MSKALAPVTAFGQFVAADIKGGDAAKTYRRNTIGVAIEQMFKGNYSPITEAAGLTSGKSKKARAYAAGFTALGQPGVDEQATKVAYVGKLDSAANKSARDEIHTRAAAAVVRFFEAFDAVMAEKAEGKTATAKPTEAPAAAPTAQGEAEPEADAETIRHELALKVEADVDAMCTMIRTGYLTTDQFDRIAEAVIAYQHVQQHAAATPALAAA